MSEQKLDQAQAQVIGRWFNGNDSQIGIITWKDIWLTAILKDDQQRGAVLGITVEFDLIPNGIDGWIIRLLGVGIRSTSQQGVDFLRIVVANGFPERFVYGTRLRRRRVCSRTRVSEKYQEREQKRQAKVDSSLHKF